MLCMGQKLSKRIFSYSSIYKFGSFIIIYDVFSAVSQTNVGTSSAMCAKQREISQQLRKKTKSRQQQINKKIQNSFLKTKIDFLKLFFIVFLKTNFGFLTIVNINQ
jgi:hypothetical protein